MPLNFLARVHHGRENNERISGNDYDLDVLLDEENGDGNDDVEDESTEENDQEWGKISFGKLNFLSTSRSDQ